MHLAAGAAGQPAARPGEQRYSREEFRQRMEQRVRERRQQMRNNGQRSNNQRNSALGNRPLQNRRRMTDDRFSQPSANRPTTATTTFTSAASTSTVPASYMQALESADRGPLRTALELLDPADRQRAMEYIRGLDQAQRRSVVQQVQRAPVEQRKAKFLDLLNSGKPPVTARDVMAQIGAKAAADTPEIVMNQSAQTDDFTISASGAGGANGQLPGPGANIARLLRDIDAAKPLLAQAGRPVILQVGSITSPRYRAHIEDARRLADGAPPGTAVITIYSREAHPKGAPSPFASGEWIPQANLRANLALHDTKTPEERTVRANLLRTQFGDRSTPVIDDKDDSLWKALGARSHALFIISADGRVLHSSDPADFQRAASALNNASDLSPRTAQAPSR